MLRLELDAHLKRQLANRDWLYRCLQEDVKAFPHRIAEEGHGEILSKSFCYPKAQPARVFSESRSGLPCFIVNIPEGMSPSLVPVDRRYPAILEQLRLESFASTSRESASLASSQIAVVVGTNQVESLDREVNRAFARLIQKTGDEPLLASSRLGFLWRAKYETRGPVYPPKKSFLLLKAYSRAAAQKVREFIESSNIAGQIPFQRIRETILKSRYTRDFVAEFQEKAPTSPLYLTVMDADFLSLRIEEGVFSKATTLLLSRPTLSVIGCGYSVREGDLPIIKLAVQLDMAARRAMNACIPYSAYLPEPFLAVLLCRPGERPHLDHLSFLGHGRALESRRLIENGRARGVLDDQVAFIEKGIVTTSPERWKTKKNRSYSALTRKELKQKAVLEALRGLSQSHIHPKKWADQVYLALDFSSPRVTDVTAPMMRIFSVFDPISRMFGSPGRFTSLIFDRVMKDYGNPLTDIEKDILSTSKIKLLEFEMPLPIVEGVITVAQATGRAIHEEFLNLMVSLGK